MSLHSSYTGVSLNTAYQSFPKSSMGYQSNNQHKDFPPLMNDGRSVLCSWQPGAVVNENILKENNIQSNWEYRRYLTHNSLNIQKNLLRDAMNDVGYSIRNEKPDLNKQFSSPKVYGSIYEPISHLQASPSDLQSIYLTREQLYSRMEIPTYKIETPAAK